MSGKGLTFVFIHGFSGAQSRWAFQLEHARQLGGVLALDLPGHGGTPWQGEDLDQMADGVIGFLEGQGITGNVIPVASSFGGLVALTMWQKRPSLFRHMVFAGSVPRFTCTDDFPAGLDASKIASLRRQIEHDFKAALDVFFRGNFTPQERASTRYARIRELRRHTPAPSPEALHAFLDILNTADLRHVLRTVTVPVTFVLGDGDYICPPAVIAPLQQLCPQAVIKVMPGCGHLPFLTEPEVFNAILTECAA